MKIKLNDEFNLYENKGQAFCDSLQIAESFEKEHAKVLRTIENLTDAKSGLSEEFEKLNFTLTSYKDKSGKSNPKYLLTKDGFTMVTFGYTGKKAMAFKEAYVKRFNQMELFIHTLLEARLDFPELTEAVKSLHEVPRHYHYTNEINMINRIVLGMTATEFKTSKGLDKDIPSIRPYLTQEQIQALSALQKVDIGLIYASKGFEERKEILIKRYESLKLKLIA